MLTKEFCGQICESLTSGPCHAIDITREVSIHSFFVGIQIVTINHFIDSITYRQFGKVLKLWLLLEEMELFMRYKLPNLIKIITIGSILPLKRLCLFFFFLLFFVSLGFDLAGNELNQAACIPSWMIWLVYDQCFLLLF